MGLRIGVTAPDFQACATQGTIRLCDWLGGPWAVPLSRPKDFTPVCTAVSSPNRHEPTYHVGTMGGRGPAALSTTTQSQRHPR
jgi:hypothetical protein